MTTTDDSTKKRSSLMLLIVSMVSMVMLFTSLVSAFIVSKGGVFWVNINLPSSFWFSTGVILFSSFTISLALVSAKRNKSKAASALLTFTLALGFLFSVLQYQGWKQLYDSGSYFTADIMDRETGEFLLKGEYGKDFWISFKGADLSYEDGRLFFPNGTELTQVEYDKLNLQRNTASSYIYLLTFLHLLHLVGGLIYLTFVTLRSYRQDYDSGNSLKIKLISVYWHFLDGLWVFLFIFLQFIH